jgi:uncharacterized membrane protein YhaH (DUF805 family)
MFSRESPLKWGRCNRKGYWISLGALLTTMVLATAFLQQPESINRVLGIAWIIIWIHRLHDIGRSAWFVLVPMGLSVVPVLIPLLGIGNILVLAFNGNQEIMADPSIPADLERIAMVGIGLLIYLGFSFWIGVKPGDVGRNRFGPAPK